MLYVYFVYISMNFIVKKTYRLGLYGEPKKPFFSIIRFTKKSFSLVVFLGEKVKAVVFSFFLQ